MPSVWPETIRANQLTARGTAVVAVLMPCLERPAAATAVPARSPAATPDGRTGCKTAGRAPRRGREVLFAARTIAAKKSGSSRWALTLAPRVGTRARRVRRRGDRPPGLGRLLPDDARHSDSDTAGSEPGVSPDRWGSADTAGWLVVAAIAAPRLGTRGYSIGPGGGWVERASRIP